MKKLLSSLIQSGALATGLLCCGTHVLAQEPGFPPETSAPPPQPGPAWSHRGMMDPAQQLAGMTTRYTLTTDQQNQVKPILMDQQRRMRLLRLDSSLSPDEKKAKMLSILNDINSKIEAILNDDQRKQFEQDHPSMQQRMQQPGQGGGPGGGGPPPQQ
jgi:hypothetical protein